jgi:cell wall-associated NlpC family hydrolase
MEATHMRNDETTEATQPPEKVWTARRRVIANNTAEAFRGTKHVNRLALPGEGVDCIHFVMAVLEAAGVVPRFRLPFYDERLGSFRARNVMEDLFEMHFFVSIHPAEAAPEFGDVVICKCGRQSNHVGILLDGWLWHVPSNGYCIPEDWSHWHHRTQSLIRFATTGLKSDPHQLRWRQIKALADRPL